jgi:hypothetical protein
MAKYHGKNAKIYVGGTNYSGDSNSWALNVAVSNSDSSVFTDTWDTNLEGTPSWTGSFNFFAEGDGTNGITDELFALIGGGAFTVHLYPQNTTSGLRYWYGTANVTALGEPVTRNDAVAGSFGWNGTGALTNNNIS